MSDPVREPAHYCFGGLECFDVMRALFGDRRAADFCRMNAFKYLWRAEHKGTERQDIEKARQYLTMWLDLTAEKQATGPTEEEIADEMNY